MKINKKETITPIIYGSLKETPSEAATVSSPFGTSRGTRKVQRLILKDLTQENRAPCFSSNAWIATAKKIFWLQKFFYIQCIVRDADGKDTKIWVNKNSLKKRLSQTPEQKKILWDLLPNAAKKIDPNETYKQTNRSTETAISITPKETSPLLPLQKNDPFAREHLVSAIKDAANKQLTEEEIEKILDYVETHPQAETRLIRRNVSGCERTLLLGPQNQNYLLLTRAKNKSDPVLGKGSFKKAKFAIDLSTGGLCVVAVARLLNKTSASSIAEINTHNALKTSPHVVKLHTSYITAPGELIMRESVSARKCYMVLEYCDQGDLYQLLSDNKTKQTDLQKLLLASDIAKGLLEIHEQKYLHRDMKPENIFVYTETTKTGETNLRAKVADLGLACYQELAKRTGVGGTPLYSSPEKLQAMLKKSYHATTKDDIWALGLIFYSLFEGSSDSLTPKFLKPFSYEGVAKIKQTTIDSAIESLQNVPNGIKPLLKSMLTIDPTKRGSLDSAIKVLHRALQSAAL